ncbi:MAG: hypothetical protein KatS3mg101_0627 [Patescibacteria group bacterium]|nr:MAG: hypothetical protein KatS3mg101_0627 [Patescibacteria group bacterium]
MDKKIENHEKFIKEILGKIESNSDLQYLSRFHRKMMQHFQAERLVHLIITMFWALFTLIMTIAAIVTENTLFYILAIILIVLLVPYIIHYYKVENGVQRLYEVDRLLLEKLEAKNVHEYA